MMIEPRHSDLPGLTHHVMLRSIPEVPLLRDSQDNRSLGLRIARVLSKVDARILAFAFMRTHLHLLIQIGLASLSDIIHRITTGYVLKYNARHGRSGRLLDNHFLSKVVDSESYLQKVMPYVLLNPVRAGIVESLDELAEYEWAAYSSLMGNATPVFVAVPDALRIYGPDVDAA